jgi:signal transduction histidine kinase
MKDFIDAFPYRSETRPVGDLFHRLAHAEIWRAILGFSHKNRWWIISFLVIVTILLEMGEHLKLFPELNLFFYGEITYITILLIISGLAKTSSPKASDTQKKMNDQWRQEEMVLQQTWLEQKTQAVHKELARDLHDTLGQNISYLRMRLEYLTDHHLPPINELEKEIRRMAEVANESYDQVRGTLAALQAKTSNGLYPLLAGHAHQVSDRASIQIDITEQGCPQQLPSNTLMQIFFIFREAIYNIEKHACASQIRVNIVWREESLLLVIADDGCGFDAAQIEQNGHFGLRFMRERTERLNGNFTIQSAKGAGTTIHICL